MTDEEFRAAARAAYQKDGEIEIDAGAIVSRGSDPGAYVQAWVWVYDPRALEDDADDDACASERDPNDCHEREAARRKEAPAEAPPPPLVVEWRYPDGDVGSYPAVELTPAEQSAVTQLWMAFSGRGAELVIRPQYPDPVRPPKTWLVVRCPTCKVQLRFTPDEVTVEGPPCPGE